MSAAELVMVGVAVFAAAMVQIISGFGFALLAVPLMTLAIPTRDAVIVSTLLGMGVSLFQAAHGRTETDWRLVRRLTAGAYVGMPFGLWVFVALDDHVLRLVLGISVLVAVVLLASGLDLHHTGAGLDLGAGFLSGVLNTSVSTNGPPLVFALQARHLAPQPFRSTITTVFVFSNVAGISLFVAAGKVHRDGLIAAAIALPSLVVGQLAGFPLRRHLHGDRFRRVVLGLLVLAGLSAIVAALA